MEQTDKKRKIDNKLKQFKTHVWSLDQGNILEVDIVPGM